MESLKTGKAEREAADSKLAKKGEDVFYPSWDELKAEDREESPEVLLTIRDENGQIVRHIAGSTSKGLHRATWNFRYPGYTPTSLNGDGRGPMAVPGTYTVEISKRVHGVVTELVAPTLFEIVPLGLPTLPPADREAILAFQRKTGRLQRAIMGSNAVIGEVAERIQYIKRTIEISPDLDAELLSQARALEIQLMDIREKFRGDPTRPRRSETAPPGILSRIQTVVGGHWSTTTGPTNTHRQVYEIAEAEFGEVYGELRQLVEVDLTGLEQKLEDAGAPWTPGRGLPKWSPTGSEN